MLLKKDNVAPLGSKDVDANWISQIINKYKTKTTINNAIVKKYKVEKAKVIYKAIKLLLNHKEIN